MGGPSRNATLHKPAYLEVGVAHVHHLLVRSHHPLRIIGHIGQVRCVPENRQGDEGEKTVVVKHRPRAGTRRGGQGNRFSGTWEAVVRGKLWKGQSYVPSPFDNASMNTESLARMERMLLALSFTAGQARRLGTAPPSEGGKT